jgi:signal transduction histidine kinase
MEDALGPRRVVFVRPYHCAACVAEMVRSAKLQRITLSGSDSMERVREILRKQRAQLVDRWDRQLRAAAEAGFALDPGTAQVLPHLLEAVDRVLERRFRAPAASGADGRRAALQYSLLGDFLFDSVLENLPEMNLAEQRLLSDALAQSAIEVLVGTVLDREQDRRRREASRLAALAHELRESMTAAQLSLDLLRRRGALPGSRTARALERSMTRLRHGIEDGLLDELLAAGGLHVERLKLAPVLAMARAQAHELGANDKKLQVVLPRRATPVRVTADPRLVQPAVRGLLRAAVEVARPGTVIRMEADRARNRACVAVVVADCQKLPGYRLQALPALSFARRAARAHGGALVTKILAPDGCEMRLEFPEARGKSQTR